MQFITIAHAHNGFTDKFGIPRQSREESNIETRIVFTPEYRSREAIRGIEGYSHLWLLWIFSENENKMRSCDPASRLTVRPPRLGGNKHVGVFATRSPFRPNPIGLTSVRLLRIEETANEGTVLIVSGADLMDGTPIIDIKPYLSFSDSHPDSVNGFAEETKDYRLEVIGTDDPELIEILSQDPRPAYQDDPNRIYTLTFNRQNISFRVADNQVIVEKITPIFA